MYGKIRHCCRIRFWRAAHKEFCSSADVAAARTVYIETYGCQMNVADSQIVEAVLAKDGWRKVEHLADAKAVLLNTCAIRDHAEEKIWGRLGYFSNLQRGQPRKGPEPRQIIGVLGCMAERLKHSLLEGRKKRDGTKLVRADLVAGPDAYRDLPRLLNLCMGESIAGTSESSGAKEKELGKNARTDDDSSMNLPMPSSPQERERSHQIGKTLHRMGAAGNLQSHPPSPINVQLSVDETYADIAPVRPANQISVYLSIMRGCNNMCSFCIVPFVRGRERSRPYDSIMDEVKRISDEGRVKEITLLGQNVNSYSDSEKVNRAHKPSVHDPFDVYAEGFRSVYKPKREGVTFAKLLHDVASVNREIRIRFTSPHPKDFSNEVLDAIASNPNICNLLHMPAQSGSTSCLERMGRGYTREAYLNLVETAKAVIPGVALSSDFISGFCGETEDEHQDTLSLLDIVQYDQAFMFKYSRREKTLAARRFEDDVDEPVKQRRLEEVIDRFRRHERLNRISEVGRIHLVLIEGRSKREPTMLTGRTDTFKLGDYACIKILNDRMVGRAIARTSIQEFFHHYHWPVHPKIRPLNHPIGVTERLPVQSPTESRKLDL